MLKSIVNGAEHDIISIPMKGKNLFDPDSTRYHMGKASNDTIGNAPNAAMFYIKATSNTSYTVKAHTTDSTFVRLYLSNAPIVEGVAESYNVISESETTINPEVTISNTNYAYLWIQIGGTWYTEHGGSSIMLNTGSTALPYEPYGYQNGWEVRDNQNRLIWGREDDLQTTTGNLLFKGYDLPVKVNSLLGSAAQNGTQSPDSPIVPEFCGVRTENLINVYANNTSNGYIDNAMIRKGGDIYEPSSSFVSEYQPINESVTYTLNTGGRTGDAQSICFYTSDKQFISGIAYESKTIITFTTPQGAKYFRCTVMRTQSDTESYKHTMLNVGTESIPFEQYGYKIPFTCAGQTTPIYLGEVPTIRRIKKLVLTGEETNFYNKNDNSSNSLYFIRFAALTGTPVLGSPLICTHLINTPGTPSASAGINVGTSYQVIYLNIGLDIMNAQPSGNTVAGLKEYLTAQYANGTPVTVWYILSEQQTGIVNEPLAKIGNYTDELTEISVHNLSSPLYGIGDYKDILNLSTGGVTRKIKKLVLTGNENIEPKSGNGRWYIPISDMKTPANLSAIEWCCSHYQAVANDASWASYDYMISWSSVDAGSSIGLRIRDIDFLTGTTLADFKSFLAQQYQNGTPVTIWYVLATPETETVTVPTGMTGEIEGYLTQISTPTPEHPSIPKWNGKEETGGTYAVTVYDLPEIPTTTGQNKLTVDTTLAPYNVTINGHIKYTYWGKIREDVRSGLAQTKFPVGTILYDNEDATTGRAFQVVGYDKHFDPSLTARGYTHSMTLCQLKLSGPWQFDAQEAFLYVEQEMEPATYRIRIPDGYDDANGGNGRSYLFTTTKTIPVGGQITLSWGSGSPPTSVSTYSSSTSTTALDSSKALTLWDESTEAVFIGTIKYDHNTDDSVFGKLNQIQRVRYGSNNYYQSGLRQLLNTDLASNNWWHPTTIFDRPYANRTTNGYLRSLNEDFINVLATPEITHIANNVFEYPSLDGRTFALNTEYKINTDKVFLLSHTEVGLSSSPNVGTVLDYYSTHNTNNDRIKYRIDNGNAYYWWLRTPYPPHAYLFRIVLTSGALGNFHAYYSNGVAPAHIIQ